MALFCLLLFPYPLPLPQFLLFHKHTALMGPEGHWGYAISSHINNPTAIHNMHAFFPSLFSSRVYFYSLKQNRFLGSNQRGPKICRVFVGITIFFSMKQSRLFLGNSLQTIWSGLLFWSKAVQSERRKRSLSYRSECYVGRVRKFDLWGQTEPTTLCECMCLSTYVCLFL